MTDANVTNEGRTCPWCSASVAPNATHCRVCGDALAQRESIDGLDISGVTSVDPALQDYDAHPLHIPLPVPSGVGPVSNVAGGMAGMAALAAPYGSSIRSSQPVDPGAVGKPSVAALEAADRMDREDASS